MQGGFDDRPAAAEDAPATLVAREGTHPALIQLFVQAAQKILGGAGWFQRKGDFLSPLNTERALAKEAQRFYQTGVPML